MTRTLATVALAAWSLAPMIDTWESWVLMTCAAASAALLSATVRAEHRVLGAGVVTLLLAALTGALLGWSTSVDAVDDGGLSDDAVIVTMGALAAVFAGGAAIERLLAPFVAKVTPAASADLASAGLLIGWLERAVVFGFVVGGAAGGAALVVAAKSLARLPSLSKEDKFAEYFLIGTLASVLVAVGAGVAVRAILGLTPALA